MNSTNFRPAVEIKDTNVKLRNIARHSQNVAPVVVANDWMVEAFRDVEGEFVNQLGDDARGRVYLRKNEDGWIEHLVFRNGKILYESGWPGEPLDSESVLDASEEVLTCAGDRVGDLWEACGGDKLDAPKIRRISRCGICNKNFERCDCPEAS